jgi:hypothetical protein
MFPFGSRLLIGHGTNWHGDVGTGFDAFAVGAKRGLGKPETFNFFGVPCISVACPVAASSRFTARRTVTGCAPRCVSRKGELKRRMHEPIPQQGRWPGQVVRGYFVPRGANQRFTNNVSTPAL